MESILEDYNGNQIRVGDKVRIINVDDVDQPSNNDPLVLGDIFIVAGGNDDNIVYVVRDTDGETYGLFGERFEKIFE